MASCKPKFLQAKLQVSNFRSGRNSHLRQASGIRNGENMDEGVDEKNAERLQDHLT
jgi:hypothetical protein